MTKYLKAIYGAVLTCLAATTVAYLNGKHHIDFVAGIGIATATITSFGVVWGVPNAPAVPTDPAAPTK